MAKKALVTDSVIKLSNGKKYHADVTDRRGWNMVCYNPGDTLLDLADRAIRFAYSGGDQLCMCIISMGNGLEKISRDTWVNTTRARYWQKLQDLRKLVAIARCTKITIIFGGHGHWNGYNHVSFQYILDDVLYMASSLGMTAASGIEENLCRDGHNPILERLYDRSNHFLGTAREMAMDWLDDVLEFADDRRPLDLLPLPPAPLADPPPGNLHPSFQPAVPSTPSTPRSLYPLVLPAATTQVLVGDTLLKLSNRRRYFEDVAQRLNWKIGVDAYTPGATLPDLVGIASKLCKHGLDFTLCIISKGEGLANVSWDMWLGSHRARYWQQLLALGSMLDKEHCNKVTLLFGGHAHWHGYDPGFQLIIDDVLNLARGVGINAASGSEDIFSRDGQNPIVDRLYDENNVFAGTARDIAIAWLDDVLAFAAYADASRPRDLLPSDPGPAEDLAPQESYFSSVPSPVAARNATLPGDIQVRPHPEKNQ